MSRTSRSLRRGKCDAVPKGQEPRAAKYGGGRSGAGRARRVMTAVDPAQSGSDEQMFGADRLVLHGRRGD